MKKPRRHQNNCYYFEQRERDDKQGYFGFCRLKDCKVVRDGCTCWQHRLISEVTK